MTLAGLTDAQPKALPQSEQKPKPGERKHNRAWLWRRRRDKLGLNCNSCDGKWVAIHYIECGVEPSYGKSGIWSIRIGEGDVKTGVGEVVTSHNCRPACVFPENGFRGRCKI